MSRDPRQDVVTDLMRSAWAVETARSLVYRRWAAADRRFEASSHTALDAAAIFERELSERGRRTDPPIAEGHAEWITSLVGDDPGATPLADWFVTRLADWVDAHAGDLLSEGADRLKELHESDKQILSAPEMPAAPPYEAVPTPPVEPPGDVAFRFAILGDIHIGSPSGEAMARAAIADINDSGADLTIQLGDLADHGKRDEFAQAAKIMNELAMPWEVITGNHDMYSTEEERLAGREYFTEHFNRSPDGHMTEHEGHRFVLLDSAEEVASPFAPYNLVSGQFMDGNGGAIVRGALTTPQHEILAEVAAPGSPPAFVFLHHPTQPFTSFPPIVFGLRDADSGRLHAVCDSGNVFGVFAGHTHRNKLSGRFGIVPVTEVGIPRDYPFGYGLVDVTANGYAYHFHQISNEDLLREAYPVSGQIHRNYARGAESDRAFSWTR
ncbi:MAG: metallophosphoesterase family protein [Actinomycetota bacterium]